MNTPTQFIQPEIYKRVKLINQFGLIDKYYILENSCDYYLEHKITIFYCDPLSLVYLDSNMNLIKFEFDYVILVRIRDDEMKQNILMKFYLNDEHIIDSKFIYFGSTGFQPIENQILGNLTIPE